NTARTHLMEVQMFKIGTIATATNTLAATACAIATITAAAPAASAGQGPDIVTYTKAGLWTIQRVNDNGAFNYCRAGLTYESGIQVYMLGFKKGWMVQFFSNDWPKREVTKFDGTLEIDGRTVPTRANSWRGNSVFIGLGSTIASMAPLMRGSVMTVVTAAGKSSFSLRGSSAAIKLTARCRAEGLSERQNQPVANAPAGNQGAFGGRPVSKSANTAPDAQPHNKSYKFNRAQTIAHAKGYLRKTPHTLIAGDKNVFKHFPVNWKTRSGIIGGMMIVANTNQTLEDGISSLSGDNAKTCEGKSEVAQTFTTQSPMGKKSMVTTTCQTDKGLRVLTFSVIERAPKTLMLIVEGYFQAKTPKTAGSKPKLEAA
ncbi:MAG: hypothetical protein AAGG99_07655, partial [Pseudomonadota bacterium]